MNRHDAERSRWSRCSIEMGPPNERAAQRRSQYRCQSRAADYGSESEPVLDYEETRVARSRLTCSESIAAFATARRVRPAGCVELGPPSGSPRPHRKRTSPQPPAAALGFVRRFRQTFGEPATR
jgi:hypothetical protein